MIGPSGAKMGGVREGQGGKMSVFVNGFIFLNLGVYPYLRYDIHGVRVFVVLKHLEGPEGIYIRLVVRSLAAKQVKEDRRYVKDELDANIIKIRLLDPRQPFRLVPLFFSGLFQKHFATAL